MKSFRARSESCMSVIMAMSMEQSEVIESVV